MLSSEITELRGTRAQPGLPRPGAELPPALLPQEPFTSSTANGPCKVLNTRLNNQVIF